MSGSHGRMSSRRAVIVEVYSNSSLGSRVCCDFCRNQARLKAQGRSDNNRVRRIKPSHKTWEDKVVD